MNKKRASGVLLHITSLPSRFGIGDLGPTAYKFADFLARAGQSYWQILPLNPPAVESSPSPYSAFSAFAGYPLLISPELLYQQNLLTKNDIHLIPASPQDHIDYNKVIAYKTNLLNIAYDRFANLPKESYRHFCSQNSYWLDDFATFASIRQRLAPSLWCDWPADFKDKNKLALKSLDPELQDQIEKQKFLQYQFFKQWFSLKHYCSKLQIKIIGDVPFYVAYDSADVWANPTFFKLTRARKPRFIAGVPPDSCCKTGQLWGNPVYDWKTLRKVGYSWWLKRIAHSLTLFDTIRIDHFRGFVAYWQVPANHKTAVRGKWVKAPKEDFFTKLFERFPSCPIIAEDLGYITPAVKAFIEKMQLTGMRILIFGFDGDPAANDHCLRNHPKNSVVYTTTHDTNTVKGWFEKEAGPQQKTRLFDCLGRKAPASRLNWNMIELAMSSASNLAIIPMQDVLGLGQNARMNRPGSITDNWIWRLQPSQITPAITCKLRKLTQAYHRI